MNLNPSPEEQAWREEVRQFLRENPPESFPVQQPGFGWGFGPWSREFARRVGEKGWISITWPREHGGQAQPVMRRLILWEEIAYHRAPGGAMFFADNLAHTLMTLGSPRLKKELLPGIAQGRISFWLALSEPEAGTDLLNVQTSAREEGDHYVVNGQKTWSSHAHLADYGFLLARTDPAAPKHRGLSTFILDKRTPGVTVTPLLSLAGEHYHNQLFLDNVRISKDFLLGEKNQGLMQMLKGLEIDRFWARFLHPPYLKRLLEDLVDYARETVLGREQGRAYPLFRRQLAELAIEIEVCRMLFYRLAWMISSGQEPGTEASTAKLFADELAQRVADTGMQMLGLYGQLQSSSKWAQLGGRLERLYLYVRGHTIDGGTSEVIRNVVATRGLGLPR